jgi:hypothetical protein
LAIERAGNDMSETVERAAVPPRTKTAAKRRRELWTAAKRKAFLEELATTVNVAAAAKKARISSSSAYRERQKNAGFRAAWEDAIREGYAQLEVAMLERALNGVDKPVFQTGKEVGRVREYSDRLALTLFAAHRETAKGARAQADDEAAKAARAEIEARLELMARRLADED